MRSDNFPPDNQGGQSRLIIPSLKDYAGYKRELERLFQQMPATVPAPGNRVWDRFAVVAAAVVDFEKAHGMRVKPP